MISVKVDRKLYEQVKEMVLAELEEQKINNRRINLAADAVFAQAKRRYLDKIADKYGRGRCGNPTGSAYEKFFSATKLALSILGIKNAKCAYLNGLGEDANKKAEQILEVILKE